ncbi:MAG: tetratricopeptide repeat protein [Desulfovibrionaceae bacterium]
MRVTPLFRPGLLILATLLALAACAPQKGAVRPDAPQTPLSPEASLTYDYLLYEDQRSQLEAVTRLGADITQEEYQAAFEYQRVAAEALDRILAVQPSAKLYGEKASLFFNSKQMHQARAILSEALGKYPGDRFLVGMLASAYLLEGNTESAGLLLEQYLYTAPEDHEVRLRLAGILIDSEQYAKALDQIQIIPRNERDKVALYLQARAESRLGKRRQALKTLDKVFRMDPEYYEAWAEAAYLRELENDMPGAVGAYEKLLELGGPEEELRIRLVTLLLKLNNVDRALAVALEGPPAKAYLLSASGAFLNQGFPAQASAVLDTMAGFDPVPSEFYFYKAVIAFEAEEDADKALTYLDQVPPDDERRSQAMEFRIQILHSKGRDTEALKLIQQGQAEFPDATGFYEMEAEYWASQKNEAAALEALERGLAIRPDNAGLLYRYGTLLERSGRRAEALETMEKIIKSDPQHADALNFIGYTLAEEERDLKRALILVQNALMQEPDNGYIIDSLAWVHYKAGELALAWEQIQRAVAEVPKDPVLWEHYGDIAKALDKKISALEGYRKALQYGSEDAARVKDKIKSL